MADASKEEYCGMLLKFSTDQELTPLISILSTKDGRMCIFADNSRLTQEQKVEVMAIAYHTARKAVNEERQAMTNFSKKIHKA